MSSIREKMLVAENCIEYEPKSFTINMSFISQGCSSCISYIDGKCDRELFEGIRKSINMN
jgi:hypothetical protein